MEKYLENYYNFINQLKNIFINDELHSTQRKEIRD